MRDKIWEWPGDEATKVHNSVKLDVRSSEWDDTRCVTCAWDTVDRNRKFSEVKRSKMRAKREMHKVCTVFMQRGKSLVHTLTSTHQNQNNSQHKDLQPQCPLPVLLNCPATSWSHPLRARTCKHCLGCDFCRMDDVLFSRLRPHAARWDT